jgi:hypothetical protein
MWSNNQRILEFCSTISQFFLILLSFVIF